MQRQESISISKMVRVIAGIFEAGSPLVYETYLQPNKCCGAAVLRGAKKLWAGA